VLAGGEGNKNRKSRRTFVQNDGHKGKKEIGRHRQLCRRGNSTSMKTNKVPTPILKKKKRKKSKTGNGEEKKNKQKATEVSCTDLGHSGPLTKLSQQKEEILGEKRGGFQTRHWSQRSKKKNIRHAINFPRKKAMLLAIMVLDFFRKPGRFAKKNNGCPELRSCKTGIFASRQHARRAAAPWTGEGQLCRRGRAVNISQQPRGVQLRERATTIMKAGETQGKGHWSLRGVSGISIIKMKKKM